MPFFGQSRGPGLGKIRPRVLKTGDKMGLPWDAYYVLTKANARLTNSKIHPNTGAPNYNIIHNVSDLVADADLDLAAYSLSAAFVNITDETTGYQIDGNNMLWTGATVDENLFIGEEAFDSDEGRFNVGIGFRAGMNNTTVGVAQSGKYNLYLGLSAGEGITPGIDNSGYSNVALGYRALTHNTTGNANLSIGANSSYENTEGFSNVAIGYAALNKNETGNTNVAIGRGALFENIDGDNNVAIGYNALENNTVSPNVAIGAFALTATTNGENNVAIGYGAMLDNLGGKNNVAVGQSALHENVAGLNNVGLGYNALWYNTGSDNIGIGRNTNYFNKTGSNNVTIGRDAGFGALNQSHKENVIIGYRAGFSLSTGDSNVFIGFKAAYKQTTISDRLIIDNMDRTSIALEITNALIYGVFNADPLLQSLRFNAATRTGVGANYLEVDATGDLTFVGGAGLAYGDIYGLDETITCTTQNTWYQITFDTAGPSNNTTPDTTENHITIAKAGAYKIGLTVCCRSAVAHDFEVMVKKNNGATDFVQLHLFQSTAVANQIENIAGSAIASLSANDTIEAWVQCTDAAGIDFVIHHADLNVIQVGGT